MSDGMTRIVFGNERVGVLGIYYFDSGNIAEEYAEDVCEFMYSIRRGEKNNELKEKWKDDTALYNFIREIEYRTENESDPSVWWERGGKYWGEKWERSDLPNGQNSETHKGGQKRNACNELRRALQKK